MVEADKRTALAQDNPVLKVNPHVIPYKMNPTIIDVVSFIFWIVMVLVDSNSELKCISAYISALLYMNAAHYMQHARYVILNFL